MDSEEIAADIAAFLGRTQPSAVFDWLLQLQDDEDGDLLALCIGIDAATHEGTVALYCDLIDDCLAAPPNHSPRFAFYKAMESRAGEAPSWVGLSKWCSDDPFEGEPQAHVHVTAIRFLAEYQAYGSSDKASCDKLKREFQRYGGEIEVPLGESVQRFLTMRGGAPSQAVFVGDLDAVQRVIEDTGGGDDAAEALVDGYGLPYPFDSVDLAYLEYGPRPWRPLSGVSICSTPGYLQKLAPSRRMVHLRDG